MLALGIAHARPFNTDFYVVAATVLPILYIAMMVPPGLVGRLGQAARHVEKLAGDDRTLRGISRFVRVVVYVSYVAFAVGEITALIALLNRSVGGGTQTVVLVALVLMAALTAVSGRFTALGVSEHGWPMTRDPRRREMPD